MRIKLKVIAEIHDEVRQTTESYSTSVVLDDLAEGSLLADLTVDGQPGRPKIGDAMLERIDRALAARPKETK